METQTQDTDTVKDKKSRKATVYVCPRRYNEKLCYNGNMPGDVHHVQLHKGKMFLLSTYDIVACEERFNLVHLDDLSPEVVAELLSPVETPTL